MSEKRRRLVMWGSMVALAICIVVGNGMWYLHSARERAAFPQIDIPVLPEAERLTDRFGNGSRQIRYQVAISYPSLAVLEFYQRELEGEGEGEWIPVELSWIDSPGVWEEAEYRVTVTVGGVQRPTGPSQGVQAFCQQAWEQRDGNMVIWVSVHDYSRLDASAYPRGIRGPNPPQSVTVILMSGEEARAMPRGM